MFLIENITLAVSGLMANKMRAMLTMLGIIIGIGSVIAIVTVGNSLSNSVTSQMESMGVSNINVSLQSKTRESGRGPGQVEQSDLMTDEMVDTFMEVYGDKVNALSITAQAGSGKAQDGSVYANISAIGVNEGYQTVNDTTIQQGRFINETDINNKKNVVVVSDKFVQNMRLSDPIGAEVRLTIANQVQKFRIVGVYEYVANGFSMGAATSDKDLTTNAFIPLTTAQKLSGQRNGYQNFTVMSVQGVDTTEFMSEISTFFNRYYKNNTRYQVSAFSMESLMETMTSMLSTVSLAIAVIAGISLLVGGIGVMNIMLVSVTERTREIGTRKALGAKNSFIRIQFIVEAIIICAIGGLLGVIVGIILGMVGASLLGYPGSPSYGTALLAVAFSMVIGIFFGYYPANKAAKLDPIEALRYE